MISLEVLFKKTTKNNILEIGKSRDNNENVSGLSSTGSKVTGDDTTIEDLGSKTVCIELESGITKDSENQFEIIPFSYNSRNHKAKGEVKIYTTGGNIVDKVIAEFKYNDQIETIEFKISTLGTLSDEIYDVVNAGVLMLNFSDRGITLTEEESELDKFYDFSKEILEEIKELKK